MTFPKIFICLAIFYLTLVTLHAAYVGKTVYGDGVFYFSWLRSLAVDKTIDFANEFAYFGVTGHPGPGEKQINIYSLGPALFWLPGYLWALRLFGGNGYGFGEQLTVATHSCLAALVGLLLLYRLLRTYFSEYISLATVTSLALGTNLLFYGAIDTVNSHALSFLLAVVSLSLLLQTNHTFLTGVSIGALGLIRPQDLVVAATSIVRPAKHWLSIAVGVTVPLTIQLIINRLQYDSWVISSYTTLPGYGFDVVHPQLLATLFSPTNGLFLWTPILLVATSGFFFPKFPLKKLPLVLPMVLTWWIVSSWSTWWQGASYSGRMFVSVLPFFSFGLAQFFQLLTQKYSQRIVWHMVVFFSGINILAIGYFLLRVP